MIEQDAVAATVTVTLDASKPEAPQDELRGLRLTRTIRAADGEDAASSEVSAIVLLVPSSSVTAFSACATSSSAAASVANSTTAPSRTAAIIFMTLRVKTRYKRQLAA